MASAIIYVNIGSGNGLVLPGSKQITRSNVDPDYTLWDAITEPYVLHDFIMQKSSNVEDSTQKFLLWKYQIQDIDIKY